MADQFSLKWQINNLQWIAQMSLIRLKKNVNVLIMIQETNANKLNAKIQQLLQMNDASVLKQIIHINAFAPKIKFLQYKFQLFDVPVLIMIQEMNANQLNVQTQQTFQIKDASAQKQIIQINAFVPQIQNLQSKFQLIDAYVLIKT